MSRPEISIPTTSTSSSPSPHTIYHVTLRLPLRTFTIQKRYSDFTSLHSQLSSQAAGQAPPAPLPAKSYFSSTLKNAALVEQRREGLESYLQAINSAADARWRDTPAWRAFLNLPASSASSSTNLTGGGDSNSSHSRSAAASSLHAALTAPTAPLTEPVAWLDAHRELKTHLHAARSAIAARDDASAMPSAASTTTSLASTASGSGPAAAAAAAHEAAAQAKKSLVRAAGLLAPLEQGLARAGAEWSRNRLGDGEVRRRKDLLAAARSELAGLETLQSLVRRKGEADAAVGELVGGGGGGVAGSGGAADKAALLASGPRKAGVGRGRVLGKETARTRELDNKGVLQLQQQVFKDQDEDLDLLAKTVRNQKELGLLIQQEIKVQDDMLRLLDEDVDRVQSKVGVASKRAGNLGG